MNGEFKIDPAQNQIHNLNRFASIQVKKDKFKMKINNDNIN